MSIFKNSSKNETQLEIGFHRGSYIFIMSSIFTILLYIIFDTNGISQIIKNKKTNVNYFSVPKLFGVVVLFAFISNIFRIFTPYFFNDSHTPKQCFNICSEVHDINEKPFILPPQRHMY